MQDEFADKSTPLEISVSRPEAAKKILPDLTTNLRQQQMILESARQSEAPTEKKSQQSKSY